MTTSSIQATKAPHTSAPSLRYTFTIKADVAPPVLLTDRDSEQLEFIPITGGYVAGEISGTVSSGGGDWCLTRADAAYQVEARYGFVTDSGDYVDVLNTGVLRHLEGESGEATEMGYFATTPIFRTMAPELQWITRSMFVGKATVFADNTTIDFYEVLPTRP
ncbi:DUF3237 family protein [Paenarthrobacter ilicis]|uniref:DUF3237 family protein n=1 Tax=Paenarthrobacter ilicis TaxID=43665 RepID=UPI0028D5801D|nr:DUF3237 family protein [Paenarthrobacter ilicis]